MKREDSDLTHVDYGVDAPGVIAGFLAAGSALYVAAVAVPGWSKKSGGLRVLRALLLLASGINFGFGMSMVAYVLRGKFRMREKMLDLIAWRGDEAVLDIGTGRGLLAIGAAKRITSGHVIGVDVWSAKDLSGNTIENALQNARLEGVEGKVEFRHGDASELEFEDGSFDVILSLLCLHNIEDEEQRQRACREIARVLRPGGKALIADYVPTGEYAQWMGEAGLEVESSRAYWREAYGLMWIAIARKPM